MNLTTPEKIMEWVKDYEEFSEGPSSLARHYAIARYLSEAVRLLVGVRQMLTFVVYQREAKGDQIPSDLVVLEGMLRDLLLNAKRSREE